ncbi:hypothetical protein Athai_04490 [Actinocatenispora thailandica]|uniref:Uncharacterized protein n=1 Tax=Actinocatenispora thailandica TaxID=227318 RepID=A0A7R7HUX4_9ACTN|nr:hypothetical protein Athai_04490 [Actinocatenispora thailandica]
MVGEQLRGAYREVSPAGGQGVGADAVEGQPQPVRGCDGDLVVQRDRLVDGVQGVEAVGAWRTDGQPQVDLGGYPHPHRARPVRRELPGLRHACPFRDGRAPATSIPGARPGRARTPSRTRPGTRAPRAARVPPRTHPEQRASRPRTHPEQRASRRARTPSRMSHGSARRATRVTATDGRTRPARATPHPDDAGRPDGTAAGRLSPRRRRSG